LYFTVTVFATVGFGDITAKTEAARLVVTERWIGGCRLELLDRTLIWNQAHLRRILREYETHHISTGRTGHWTPLRR